MWRTPTEDLDFNFDLSLINLNLTSLTQLALPDRQVQL